MELNQTVVLTWAFLIRRLILVPCQLVLSFFIALLGARLHQSQVLCQLVLLALNIARDLTLQANHLIVRAHSRSFLYNWRSGS